VVAKDNEDKEQDCIVRLCVSTQILKIIEKS
jgi:hypothetical protein